MSAPAGPGFTQVFGGGPVQPSNQLYVAITLSTANTQLAWPLETSLAQNVLGDLMDIGQTGVGMTLQLPDAEQGSQGLTAIINNIGAFAFNVLDYLGNVILTSQPGKVWMVYLASNTTTQGTWRALQFGAQSGSINVAALAGAGLQVVNQALAEAMPSIALSTSYASSVSDLATTFIWNGGSGTFTLPPVGTINAQWFIKIVNAGSGVLTVSPQGTAQIDNASTKAFAVSGSAFVFTDGTNFWSLGYGVAGTNNGFGYINIALPASGTYTISGAQLNQISYLLTGALSGDVTFVVPAAVQQYWINNQTTGGQNVIVSSSGMGGTTITVGQGTQVILYCDGTNIIAAVTGTSLPIAIADGGTGATNATGAITNLGGSAVGAAVFTTVSAAAALATLGGGTNGIAVFEAASNTAAWAAIIGTSPVTAGMYASGTSLLIANNHAIAATIASNGAIALSQSLTVSPSTGLAAVTASNAAGQAALYAQGQPGAPGAITIQDGQSGSRQWTLYSGQGAVGQFELVDLTAAASRLAITTGGQVSLYEPNFGVATGANAATISTGSFTGTLVGCTTSPSGSVFYARIGIAVILAIPALTGLSNSASLSISGLPSFLQPPTQQFSSGLVQAENSGSLVANVQAYIVPANGSITYSINNSTLSWTNDGQTKGIPASHVLVYFLK